MSVASAKGLALEIETCGDYVHSDASLVGQVVRNFVSNALKYTQRGCVQLRCDHDADCVRLVVRDTGIGIAAGELAHVFEDFYQVGVASNASRDGYGLGLSIVARIANLLGAALRIKSEPGKGTEISIALPLAGAPMAAAPAPAVMPPRAASVAPTACVLLVDDDERVRKATRALLKVEGYDVQMAGSLAEAVSIGNAHPEIRLLVTDYHLAAGETGLQVVEALRERFGARLPAVMITGDTSSAIRDLGGDHRLRMASKPIDPDKLLRIMGELLDG
jgi:CheY-like chemotaxis protein/anti-sigma regulatory factor (Ser/Thr protein kinase)